MPTKVSICIGKTLVGTACVHRPEQRQLPVSHLSEETQEFRRNDKKKIQLRKSSPKSAVNAAAVGVGTNRFASVSRYGVFFHRRKLRAI